MPRSSVRALLAAAALLAATATIVQATSQRGATALRLDPAPARAAFVYGQSGGFTPLGTFQVTIRDNGTVMLTDQGNRPSGVALHLRNPHVVFSAQTLRGLARLADAEGFFALPDLISGKHLMPDLPTHTITVHTATQTKTVTLRWTSNEAFQELYGVLSALVPVCRALTTGKQACYSG